MQNTGMKDKQYSQIMGPKNAFAVLNMEEIGIDPSPATTPYRGGETVALKALADFISDDEYIDKYRKLDVALLHRILRAILPLLRPPPPLHPITFGKKWDPDGNFIRRYVPELANFDNKFIYKPWKAPSPIRRSGGVGLRMTTALRTASRIRSRYLILISGGSFVWIIWRGRMMWACMGMMSGFWMRRGGSCLVRMREGSSRTRRSRRGRNRMSYEILIFEQDLKWIWNITCS